MPDIFKFRLYIAGDGPNSIKAEANLNALCREHLPERHEIEIVDVLRDPQRALDDKVMMTPQLVKLSPAPVRKVVGTLSQPDTVRQVMQFPV
ncbi:MAG: circadian clock KaiB family protein [Chthoniobacterales bacterium]